MDEQIGKGCLALVMILLVLAAWNGLTYLFLHFWLSLTLCLAYVFPRKERS